MPIEEVLETQNVKSSSPESAKQSYWVDPDPMWLVVLHVLYMSLNLLLGMSSAIKTLVHAISIEGTKLFE